MSVIRRFVLRALAFLPDALERLHLEWALKEISPLHPDVPWIVHRLNLLKKGLS